MGVTCKIIVNQTNDNVFRPSDHVSGIVKYAVDEPTEYKKVILSLIGKSECNWREMEGSSDDSYYRTRYQNNDIFIDYTKNLLNRSGSANIPAGSYEYNFEFILPNNIPSSHKDDNSEISYYIEATFEKPKFFSLTKTFKTDLVVYGHVDPAANGPIVYGLRKSLFRPFSSDNNLIVLKVQIQKAIHMPGELVNVEFNVANDSYVPVQIKTALNVQTTYRARCGRTKTQAKRINDFPDPTPPAIEPRSKAKLTSSIPIGSHLYSIQHSPMIEKEIMLEVELQLPLPHFNDSLFIPIVVGERSGGNDQGNEAYTDIDAPPSYLETISRERKRVAINKH